MSTFRNAFKIAQDFVEKLNNFLLSCHPIFNTDRTSFIFHLPHGSKTLRMKDMVTTNKTKGWTLTNSYEEEAAAMESALSWTLTNTKHPPISLLFCTDSKSLCEALISSHLQTFWICNSINSTSSSIFTQWIPGYSVVPGNDLADKTAKEATTIATHTILPISLPSSIQAINETIHDVPTAHEQVASV